MHHPWPYLSPLPPCEPRHTASARAFYRGARLSTHMCVRRSNLASRICHFVVCLFDCLYRPVLPRSVWGFADFCSGCYVVASSTFSGPASLTQAFLCLECAFFGVLGLMVYNRAVRPVIGVLSSVPDILPSAYAQRCCSGRHALFRCCLNSSHDLLDAP